MTTINEIKERLASIQGSVFGVKRAYASAPRGVLPASDLPIFITLVGPSRPLELGEEIDAEWRSFLMRLHVASVQQSDAEDACYPLIDAVRSVFLGRPGLGLGATGDDGPLADILDVAWMGDGGIVVREYSGQEYLCVEFRIDVQRITEVSYANYE